MTTSSNRMARCASPVGFLLPIVDFAPAKARVVGLDLQDTNRLNPACGWLGAGSPIGILISTNQGANFTVISSPFVIESNNDGRGKGERFGVDPNLGRILFYGTHLAGLWKSVNYAATWSPVTSFPVSTTANGVGIVFKDE